MNYVTLVNRSSKTLEGKWDGRPYEIKPGENAFPELIALKLKEQNPILGTEDPRTGAKDYLCGIKELNDPITPVEQSDAIALSSETMAKIRSGELRIIKGNGLYSPRDDRSPLPTVGGFEKP